jgi:hypothetical protein
MRPQARCATQRATVIPWTFLITRAGGAFWPYHLLSAAGPPSDVRREHAGPGKGVAPEDSQPAHSSISKDTFES